MVCVNYADIAAITLPYNRHHFDRVGIVTDLDDNETIKVAIEHKCDLIRTDLFTQRGATFNKWAALEYGIDALGFRNCGWLTIMDADVLWPKLLPMRMSDLAPGHLYTPLRRMWDNWPMYNGERGWQRGQPLTEAEWNLFPLHRQQQEFAGYTQIFHTSDPALSPCATCGCSLDQHKHVRQKIGLQHPNLYTECCNFVWHQTDWKHCGGADSFFQMKWPDYKKVRPPFEVLHLGPAGTNWFGRASTLANGTTPADAMEKGRLTHNMWMGRKGKRGDERFSDEKIT